MHAARMSAAGLGLRGRSQVVAGDALLHPVALLAVALLILNDHLLKQAAPGLVTGKLSDVAGLVFFPLLLQAGWEVATAGIGRPAIGSPRVLLVAIVATGVVFAAIQVEPVAGEIYSGLLGWLQWAVGSLPAVLLGQPIGSPHSVRLTPDPTDLLALPVLIVPYLVGRARAAEPTR